MQFVYSCLGQRASGYAILEEMHIKNDCLPDQITYHIQTQGFYMEEKYDEVERVLKPMTKNGCPPTSFIYNFRIKRQQIEEMNGSKVSDG